MNHDLINDELPECLLYEICGNETGSDDGYCSACRTRRTDAIRADELANAAVDSFDIRITDGGPQHHDLKSERTFFAGTGPDEDNEPFTRMGDLEMKVEQARWEAYYRSPAGQRAAEF